MANVTNNAPATAKPAATPAATVQPITTVHNYHVGKTLATAPLWVWGKPYRPGANNAPSHQALAAVMAANPQGCSPAQLVAAGASVGNWQYANWLASKGVLAAAPKPAK